MSNQTELLTSSEIAFRLQRLYADNYFCSPGYLSEINYFKPEVINFFTSEFDFLVNKKPKVDDFIYISSEYIDTKKIQRVLRFTDGWTLLAFDTYINQSLQTLRSVQIADKIAVPKSNKLFFRKFACFSDCDISSLFPRYS